MTSPLLAPLIPDKKMPMPDYTPQGFKALPQLATCPDIAKLAGMKRLANNDDIGQSVRWLAGQGF